MIRALVIAPLAGATVLLTPVIFGTPPTGLFPLIMLATIMAAWCYAAEAVLVLPIMFLWPTTRRPSLLVAAAWGGGAACLASVVVAPLPGLFGWSFWLHAALRPGALLGFGSAGAVAGLVYAYVVNRPMAMRHDEISKFQ